MKISLTEGFLRSKDEMKGVHMMSRQWIVVNNILCHKDSCATNFIPKAYEIYAAVIGSNDSPTVKAADVHHDLPQLRFSKISSRLSAYFWLEDETIHFGFQIRRRGHKAVIPGNGYIIDHYILDNTWFFLSNVTPELNKIATELGPADGTIISLGQYIRLIKELQSRDIFYIDEASPNLSNQYISDDSVPRNVKATLYPYQTDGFHWMKYMLLEKCGCILGDEMGLGKTLQIITLIADQCDLSEHHFLVIAPVTLMENWRREFSKFAPSVNVLVHHGASRTGRYM